VTKNLICDDDDDDDDISKYSAYQYEWVFLIDPQQALLEGPYIDWPNKSNETCCWRHKNYVPYFIHLFQDFVKIKLDLNAVQYTKQAECMSTHFPFPQKNIGLRKLINWNYFETNMSMGE
jgi:hypothetical protein